jgi:hypothetical protein
MFCAPSRRATFLKKASESASPERVRRVTTSNPGLRQAAFQHPGCINPGHRSTTQFSAVAAGRGKERPGGIGAQSRYIEIGIEDIFEQVMNGKFLVLAAFGAEPDDGSFSVLKVVFYL